jgi:AcrR family transcriptional regulator
MRSVKRNTRKYDATGRLAQAQRSREGVIEAARNAFLAKGYTGTTVAAIAASAGVSVEMVYKSFGGKAGLVRAVYEQALAGRGATPAPERSDALSATEKDPRAIVRGWGKFMAEVSPLASPILLLIRVAAATAADPDLTELLREADAKRLARMRHNAGMLGKRGFLRDGVSVEAAADVMWACTAPELYDLLVLRRGWPAEQLGDLVGQILEAALLPK